MSQLWNRPTISTTLANSAASTTTEPLSPTSPKLRYEGRRFAQIVKLKPEFVDKVRPLLGHSLSLSFSCAKQTR